MRAFITTRLIDLYEQLVFRQSGCEHLLTLPSMPCMPPAHSSISSACHQPCVPCGSAFPYPDLLSSLLQAQGGSQLSHWLPSAHDLTHAATTDPEAYVRQHLLPDQFLMVAELVTDPSTGLAWDHFDPKV